MAASWWTEARVWSAGAVVSRRLAGVGPLIRATARGADFAGGVVAVIGDMRVRVGGGNVLVEMFVDQVGADQQFTVSQDGRRRAVGMLIASSGTVRLFSTFLTL